MGKLEFKVVDDGSDYMKRLFAHVGSAGAKGKPTDARAIAEEITVKVDQWRSEDSGVAHTDYYLVARDREASLSPERARQLGCLSTKIENGQVRCNVSGRVVIESYLAELSAKDPAGFQLPDDRQIGYELGEPDANAMDGRPYWRTYYSSSAVRLTRLGDRERRAVSIRTPPARPSLPELNRSGTRVFGDLTAQIAARSSRRSSMAGSRAHRSSTARSVAAGTRSRWAVATRAD